MAETLFIDIRVVQAEEITEAFANRISSLVSQLRGTPVVVTQDWLLQLVAFPKTWLLIAEVEGEVAVMLTLHAFPRTSGWTAWIEGVVTDETMRGRGIGRALLEKAIAIAKSEGFQTINLSSRPERATANILYEKMGFALVPTNYRRIHLQQ